MMTAGQSTPPKNPEEVWRDLSDGLGDIYARRHISPRRYMDLYSHVFSFCTAASGSPELKVPLNGKKQTSRKSNAIQSTGSAGLSDFMGTEVYNRLKNFIKEHVESIFKLSVDYSDEALLTFYSTKWSEFRFSSQVMNGVFSYLNRHWIKREIDEGNDQIYGTYALALIVWRDFLFLNMHERLTRALLDLIRQDRDGVSVNKQLISDVISSYVELGVEGEEATSKAAALKSVAKDKPEDSSTNVYRKYFETTFLDETEMFYAEECREFMKRNPLTDYMKRVELRLKEEKDRVDLFLHRSTHQRLAKRCEKVLIESQLQVFQQHFGQLLEARRDDDLGRMYMLCGRVENGLENLRTALQDHITREGLAAIERVADSCQTDPKLYVTTILGVHERYAHLVGESFDNEPGFTQSLDKASSTFINKNAVTNKNGQNFSKRSPEFLAKYCDMLLRKSSRISEDTELERLLNQIMVVFKYIEDKDVFSTFYTHLFCKRLIAEMSASEEAEMSLITKLRQSCGYEYTNKMSKMIRDIQISKDVCSSYNEHMSGRKELDFSIMVLSTGSWPTMASTNFRLPAKLNNAIESFKAFYDGKHNGRKLTWVLSRSRGELICTAFATKKFFLSTTAQMSILMLYNDALEYTAGEIAEHLQMDKKTLGATVASLVNVELLKGEQPPSSGEYDDNSKFVLNKGYNNKKIKIDISKIALRGDAKQETEQVQKNVDEDRKNLVNACIVRVMKTRKKLSHQLLMSEVLSQLSSRFQPKVELIKRCIGQLIEKEYLKRSEEQRDVYEYMS